MNSLKTTLMILILATWLLPQQTLAAPFGTAFIYQGQLKRDDQPVSGPIALKFSLFDSEADGNGVANPILFNGSSGGLPLVQVTGGLFSVELDFGLGAFDGNARWVEVAVQTPAGDDTVLSPRQHVSPAPYALHVNGLAMDDAGVLHATGDIQTNGKVSAGAFASNSPLILKAPGNTERARIDDITGHFGIATSTPMARLHVAGTAGTDGIMFPDGTLQTTAATGGGTGFWAVNGSDISNTNSGNVVIGSPSTGAKLSIWNQSGRAVHAFSSVGDGVAGEAGSDFFSGVYGIGNAASAYGVRGRHAATQNEGYLGTKDYGVWGKALTADKWAGYFNGRGYFSDNVGIGTTSPTAKLHVENTSGAGNSVLAVTNSPDSAIFGITSNPSGYAATFAGSGVLGSGQALRVFGDTTLLGSLSVGPTGGANARVQIVPSAGGAAGGGELGLLVDTSATQAAAWFNMNNTTGSQALLLTSNSNSFPALTISGTGTRGALEVLAGVVAIGMDTSQVPEDVKLAVDGKVLCEEVEVQLSQDWPDFVFEDGYDLMPLKEVAALVRKNKHLPGMPSARDVERDGIALGEMQGKLLQKLEELTLYVIDIHQQLDVVKQENEVLRARIACHADGRGQRPHTCRSERGLARTPLGMTSATVPTGGWRAN